MTIIPLIKYPEFKENISNNKPHVYKNYNSKIHINNYILTNVIILILFLKLYLTHSYLYTRYSHTSFYTTFLVARGQREENFTSGNCIERVPVSLLILKNRPMQQPMKNTFVRNSYDFIDLSKEIYNNQGKC
jgi:hypothetical protein